MISQRAGCRSRSLRGLYLSGPAWQRGHLGTLGVSPYPFRGQHPSCGYLSSLKQEQEDQPRSQRPGCIPTAPTVGADRRRAGDLHLHFASKWSSRRRTRGNRL